MNPSKLSAPPVSNPAVALRFRDRQYAADLIAVALLEFDLFTWINKNTGATFEGICDHFVWKKRPADVLLTLCRASGFLTTTPEGHHELTDVGREYLTIGSPWYLGPYYAPIQGTPIYCDFVNILKTGKPANWQAKADGADWHESMKDEKFAKDFTALMNCRGIAFGQQLAAQLSGRLGDRKHVLDIGGGSGIYCSTLVATVPELIATVLEQPPVDRIAETEIQRHGLADQIKVFSADMFTQSWPSSRIDESTGADIPVDIVLLSNLLHDWDEPEAQAIVSKAADLLPAGGLLVIHGAIIDRDKSGPLPVAEYSSLLMNITQGKCYSVLEYESMMKNAGFVPGSYESTTGDRGFLTGVKQ